ncbi:hypothetical protein GBA52_018712 [Prunus armeniaca]|nr:hypothetical protein GBA52_018712 [Prunus armeniaca]
MEIRSVSLKQLAILSFVSKNDRLFGSTDRLLQIFAHLLLQLLRMNSTFLTSLWMSRKGVSEETKALKELRDKSQRMVVELHAAEQQSFWESYGFKIVVFMSMSMLILVVFSKR